MLNNYKKQMLIFDVDDTLSKSKQPISNAMSKTLKKLINKYLISIITGGTLTLINKQVINRLSGWGPHQLSRLFLMPVSGSQFYFYDMKTNTWQCAYSYKIQNKIRMHCMKQMKIIAKKHNIWPKNPYGHVIEDRLSQITFSGMGQNAPVNIKKLWKKKNEIAKKLMLNELKSIFPRLDIKLGGSTSIDVTLKGIDKSFGVTEMLKFLNNKTGIKLSLKDLLFFGDNFSVEGNDYAVKKMGVDCIEVGSSNQTLGKIKKLV